MHIVIKTTCMMDLLNIPLCGKKNFDTCIFYHISWEIKCFIYRQAGLRGPDPCSCCLTFYSLAPFFTHFATCLIITKTSNQIAMRKSIPGVVDVQSLGSRQTPNEHAALLDILYENHGACCSEKFTYCLLWVFDMLLWVTANIMKFWIINMLC